jgi:hypothetical protein
MIVFNCYCFICLFIECLFYVNFIIEGGVTIFLLLLNTTGTLVTIGTYPATIFCLPDYICFLLWIMFYLSFFILKASLKLNCFSDTMALKRMFEL